VIGVSLQSQHLASFTSTKVQILTPEVRVIGVSLQSQHLTSFTSTNVQILTPEVRVIGVSLQSQHLVSASGRSDLHIGKLKASDTSSLRPHTLLA
jgi:hypothetical protein